MPYAATAANHPTPATDGRRNTLPLMDETKDPHHMNPTAIAMRSTSRNPDHHHPRRRRPLRGDGRKPKQAKAAVEATTLSVEVPL
jgi:hypothetical protein